MLAQAREFMGEGDAEVRECAAQVSGYPVTVQLSLPRQLSVYA